MKKITLISLVYLAFFNCLYSAELIDIKLKDFIIMVAKDEDISILIDKDIDHELTLSVSSKIRKGTYFSALSMVLEGKNLALSQKSGIYYITDKSLDYRLIKLDFTKYEDIKNIVENLIIKDKIQYIKNSNSLLVYSTLSIYKKIKEVVDKIDKLPNQKKLKITIIDTNLDDLKEQGIQNSFTDKFSENSNFFYNLVAFPFTVTNTINTNQTRSFYSFIKLLNENKTTTLVSSPILTLSDTQKTSFKVVKNIPYLQGESKVDSDNSKTITAYSYKDIGLHLDVIPKILYNNVVYLELELNVSNLISMNENLPITSKKLIKQNFHLEEGKLFILTGINRTESKQMVSGLPFLKELPFFGWLFKYETNEENNTNLSIILEILDS